MNYATPWSSNGRQQPGSLQNMGNTSSRGNAPQSIAAHQILRRPPFQQYSNQPPTPQGSYRSSPQAQHSFSPPRQLPTPQGSYRSSPQAQHSFTSGHQTPLTQHGSHQHYPSMNISPLSPSSNSFQHYPRKPPHQYLNTPPASMSASHQEMGQFTTHLPPTQQYSSPAPIHLQPSYVDNTPDLFGANSGSQFDPEAQARYNAFQQRSRPSTPRHGLGIGMAQSNNYRSHVPHQTGWNNSWTQPTGSPFQQPQPNAQKEIVIPDHFEEEKVNDEFSELRELLTAHNSAPEAPSPKQTVDENVTTILDPVDSYNSMVASQVESPRALFRSPKLPEYNTFQSSTAALNSGRNDPISEQPRRNALVENHDRHMADPNEQSLADSPVQSTTHFDTIQDIEQLSENTTHEGTKSELPAIDITHGKTSQQPDPLLSSQEYENFAPASFVPPQKSEDNVLSEDLMAQKETDEGDSQDPVVLNLDNPQLSESQESNKSITQIVPTPSPLTVGELTPEAYYNGEGVDIVEEYQNRGRRWKPLHVFTPPTQGKYIGLKQADKLRARVPIIPPIPAISRTTPQMFLSFIYLLSQRDWEDWDQSFVKESEHSMAFFMKLLPKFDYPSRIRHITNKRVFMGKLENLMLGIASEHWENHYTDKYKDPDEFDDRDTEHPHFNDVTILFKDYSYREDVELLALTELLLKKTGKQINKEAEIRVKDPERSFSLTSWRYKYLHNLTQLDDDLEASFKAIASLQQRIASFVPGQGKQGEDGDVLHSVPEPQDLTDDEFLEEYSYYMPLDREKRVAIKKTAVEEAALQAASQAEAGSSDNDSPLSPPHNIRSTKRQGTGLKNRSGCNKYPKPESISNLKRAADAAKMTSSSDGKLRRTKGKAAEVQSPYARRAPSRASKAHAQEKTKQMYQNLPSFDEDEEDVDMLAEAQADHGYGGFQSCEVGQSSNEYSFGFQDPSDFSSYTPYQPTYQQQYNDIDYVEPLNKYNSPNASGSGKSPQRIEDDENMHRSLLYEYGFSDSEASNDETVVGNDALGTQEQQIGLEGDDQAQLFNEHGLVPMEIEAAHPLTTSSRQRNSISSQLFPPQNFGDDEPVSDIDAEMSDGEELVQSDLLPIKQSQLVESVEKPRHITLPSPVKKRVPLPSSPVKQKKVDVPTTLDKKKTPTKKASNKKVSFAERSLVRRKKSKSQTNSEVAEKLSKIVSLAYSKSKKIHDFLNGAGQGLASIADGFGSSSHPYTGGKTVLPPMPEATIDDETSSPAIAHPNTSVKTLLPPPPKRARMPKSGSGKTVAKTQVPGLLADPYDSINSTGLSSSDTHPQVSVKGLLPPSPKKFRNSKPARVTKAKATLAKNGRKFTAAASKTRTSTIAAMTNKRKRKSSGYSDNGDNSDDEDYDPSGKHHTGTHKGESINSEQSDEEEVERKKTRRKVATRKAVAGKAPLVKMTGLGRGKGAPKRVAGVGKGTLTFSGGKKGRKVR